MQSLMFKTLFCVQAYLADSDIDMSQSIKEFFSFVIFWKSDVEEMDVESARQLD